MCLSISGSHVEAADVIPNPTLTGSYRGQPRWRFWGAVGQFRQAADKRGEQGYWLRPAAKAARRAARESNVEK